jgi:FAD/FMN-containing dehydrogenase
MTLSRRDFLRASAAGAVLLGGGLPLEAQAAGLPRAQLRALRDAVRGPVFAPGNPGYNRARLVFNRRFDGIHPPAVVQPRSAADAQAVVRWANRFDVPLVARSGGNAYNGGSTSRSAVVVDVGGLDRITIDGTAVSAGPGTRNFDLYTAAARRGLAVPSGSCPNVAVGGLATGGGMGLAGRGLGLMLDRVIAYDVVTAAGERRTVEAGSDLYWALRGGGGNFALVTAVHLRAKRLSRAAWFFASYPASARAEVLATWDGLAPGAPAALTSICTLTPTRVTAFGQYLGSEAALRRLVAPLARIGGASFSAGTSSFIALQRRWAGCSEGESVVACVAVPRSTFDASSVYFAKPLSAGARRAFVAAADTGATLVCDAYGGAITSVAADATAFVHRNVRFSVQIVSYASLGTARSRVRRARAKIAPFGNGQAYQNYADLDLRNPLRAYYGSNLPRLRAIKAAVDPGDRFTTAQAIG